METKFYKLLKKAVTDDTALIRVIEQTMPLINKKSRSYNKQINEDLKSELITKTIEIVRKMQMPTDCVAWIAVTNVK